MMIYFNGDSFVSGAELTDHELNLPGYPGKLPYPWNFESGSVHTKSQDWYTKSVKLGRPDNTLLIEYERAFPNKLSKKLNIPAINNAKGGSSIDRIIRTSIIDLIKLKQNYQDITAIIGTTDMSRSEHANSDEYDENKWISASPLAIWPNHRTEIDPVLLYKLKYETNYHTAVNFYKNIILMKDFCKVNNIKLLWLRALDDSCWTADSTENSDLTYLKEYAQLSYDIDMFKIAAEANLVHTYCPGGHLSEEIHELVADELVRLLTNH